MKKIFKMISTLMIGMIVMTSTLCGCTKENHNVAVIKTNLGDMTLELYPKVAPKAVENFIKHANDKYYDGLIFHRVIKDFVIQGGDPTGTGMGGESIWGKGFGLEVSDELTHNYGALAMAHSSLPDSNGSQFYIVANKNGTHELDGDYTVFGQLTDGFDVLDKIASQATDENGKPLEDVVINSIEINVSFSAKTEF